MDGVRSEEWRGQQSCVPDILHFTRTQLKRGRIKVQPQRTPIKTMLVESLSPALLQELLCGVGGCVQEGHGNLHGTAVRLRSPTFLVGFSKLGP